MGKTPSTRLTRSRGSTKTRTPDSGGSQAAVAHPPATASARLCRHPKHCRVHPHHPLGRCGWGHGVAKQRAGERKHPSQAPSWNVSPASVTGAHFPDSGRGRVFLGQALCMPPGPRDPVWVPDKVPMPSSASVRGPQRLVLQQ